MTKQEHDKRMEERAALELKMLVQWEKELKEAIARDQKHFPTFYEWRLIHGVGSWSDVYK